MGITRNFVDGEGNYLGGNDGPGDALPAQFKRATEVEALPDHAAQKWRNGAWTVVLEPEPSEGDVICMH